MQMARTNRPKGKGYVLAFAEWLKRYRVDDMDKSDRAKLLQLMEERTAVEEWRDTLPDYERRSLNHPIVVWRKWTAATRVKKPKPRIAGVSASERARAVAGPCCQSWKRSCSRTYCCARGGERMSPPDHSGRHELTGGGACYRMNERP